MSVTLKTLINENSNPFKLTLLAGQNSIRNSVTWVYELEDDYIIPHFHGSELAVTAGIKILIEPEWLYKIIEMLVERRAAGLIINTGKFVMDIPEKLISYCNAHDFPLLVMPWEIPMIELVRTFCTHIINEQHEATIHDTAIRDAIQQRENVEEYTEILSRYYDIKGSFYVMLISIHSKDSHEFLEDDDVEYPFLNQIRRLKTIRNLKNMKTGIVKHDNSEIIILNNADPSIYPEIRKIILDLYADALASNTLHIGGGIEVAGLSNLRKSYERALTAMEMSIYRNVPYIHFKDMGFYKILFSVKNKDILYSYANEILGPLDDYENKHPGHFELLKSYIENDRSLEKTASDLYLHRNTVNYRIQKMKKLLNSPLKTVEDLFPFQVALHIRDMEAELKL